MGIRVVIGSSERDIGDIEKNWVNEQVNRRKQDEVSVCAKVLINHEDINLSLVTADCPSSRGRSRRLTGSEKEVVDLWNKLHLSENDFSSGNLMAFLKQLRI